MLSPLRRLDPRPNRLSVWLVIAVVTGAAGPASGQQPEPRPYTERVDVPRVLLDVRVTDRDGQPIEQLDAADFVVRVDGTPVRVESATWVTGALRSDGFIPAPVGGPAAPARPPVDGRLVVFLVQKDLEPTRIVGLMQLLIAARPFFSAFTARDRVAVLSFDSRLRVWTDFTNDVERVRTVLQHDLLMREPAVLVRSDAPSIVAGLDPQEARRAATMEKSLALVGRALEPLPGAKSVIVLGHGFGRLGINGVTLSSDYDDARRVLRAARASVFCLDITRADYHSLEVGLKQVAEDTGGFFERTHLFPTLALNRLAGVLASHYVLIVERPPPRKGRRRVEVTVPGRGVVVLTRDFVD